MDKCKDCDVTLDKDGYCPECEPCLHDEYDHGICLDCGEDRTEDLAAMAYDRAKDAWKYGD